MNETIKLVKSNGVSVDAETICYLQDTLSSKKYIYYTLNEIVGVEPSSTVKIYVAKVKQNDATDVPISEEEWGKLKGIMGEVLKDTENQTIKYLPISELNDPTIIDEKVIAMPTMYNYIAKHKELYGKSAVSSVTEAPIVNEPEEFISASPEAPIPVTSPIVNAEPTPEVAPLVNVAPEPEIVSEPVAPIIDNPIQAAPVEPPVANAPETTSETIDITEIEEKYNKMIEDINALRNKEIEAAKRYNATLKLNAMHNEQHASYVQSEQSSVEPTMNTISEPAPIEPTPITPEYTNNDIETNWFDMQPQG